MSGQIEFNRGRLCFHILQLRMQVSTLFIFRINIHRATDILIILYVYHLTAYNPLSIYTVFFCVLNKKLYRTRYLDLLLAINAAEQCVNVRVQSTYLQYTFFLFHLFQLSLFVSRQSSYLSFGITPSPGYYVSDVTHGVHGTSIEEPFPLFHSGTNLTCTFLMLRLR